MSNKGDNNSRICGKLKGMQLLKFYKFEIKVWAQKIKI